MNHQHLPNFLSKNASTRLFHLCQEQNYEQGRIEIYGKQVLEPRLTAWFGTEAYTYSKKKMMPQEMPAAFQKLAEHLQTYILNELGQEVVFNSLLINQYRDGTDYVSWHADDEAELGRKPIIASISLGVSRDFLVKPKAHPEERLRFTLNHGDLFLMYENFQDKFLHALPPRLKVKEPRFNLTFRSIQPCTSNTLPKQSRPKKA